MKLGLTIEEKEVSLSCHQNLFVLGWAETYKGKGMHVNSALYRNGRIEMHSACNFMLSTFVTGIVEIRWN